MPLNTIEHNTGDNDIPFIVECDFKCNLCDYKTEVEGDLKLHRRSVHLKNRDNECDQCDYKTPYPYKLKVHKKAIHGKNKDLECNQCSYETSYSNLLKRHKNTVHPIVEPADSPRKPKIIPIIQPNVILGI